MKSPARWPASRIAATLSAAALGVCCSAGVASAAADTPAFPGGGSGFAISLAVSSSYPYAGQSVTVTATTDADVGPTPYYITLYSETTGAELAACGDGTTCSATLAQGTPGTQVLEAFVGDDVPGSGHPGFVLVAANEVSVTWWQLVFHGLLGLHGLRTPA